MTEPAANQSEQLVEDLPTEELARLAGARPITSVDDLHAMAHPELWDSDEDYEAFLADLYASRRASTGLSAERCKWRFH